MATIIPAYIAGQRAQHTMTGTDFQNDLIQDAAADMRAIRELQRETGTGRPPARNWLKEASALGINPPDFRKYVAGAIKEMDAASSDFPFFARAAATLVKDPLELSESVFWEKAGAEVAQAEHYGDTEAAATATTYWIDRAVERDLSPDVARKCLESATATARRELDEQTLNEQYEQAEKSVHMRHKKRGDGTYEWETSVRVTGTGIDVMAIQKRMLTEAYDLARAEAERRQEADESVSVLV